MFIVEPQKIQGVFSIVTLLHKAHCAARDDGCKLSVRRGVSEQGDVCSGFLEQIRHRLWVSEVHLTKQGILTCQQVLPTVKISLPIRVQILDGEAKFLEFICLKLHCSVCSGEIGFQIAIKT